MMYPYSGIILSSDGALLLFFFPFPILCHVNGVLNIGQLSVLILFKYSFVKLNGRLFFFARVAALLKVSLKKYVSKFTHPSIKNPFLFFVFAYVLKT